MREPRYVDETFVECGPGWDGLLDRLRAQLEVDRSTGLTPQVLQVKEKFGRLRVYLHGESPETEALLKTLITESGLTCEVCGQQGTLGGDGWLMTRCDACRRIK